MSAELSGLYSGLSGQVDDIDARLLNVEQQILSYPTSSDFDTLSTLSSSRFNTLNSSLSSIQTKLATLETYIVNLKLSHTSLTRSFTGHTGVVARTGHHGGLTGELL